MGRLQPCREQRRQDRVELGGLDHVVQQHAVVDRVRRLFLAGAEADGRDARLAGPVDAVGAEVPLAGLMRR